MLAIHQVCSRPITLVNASRKDILKLQNLVFETCIKWTNPALFLCLNLIFLCFFPNLQQIPRKFVKHLPKELPDQAILRDSSGDEWRVKLCKTAEDIYLQDGWKQCFEDHSLGDNEFLLFKYNGEMSFDVLIFGKDGCERLYGPINKHTPVHDEADQLTKLKEKDIQRRKKLEEKEPPTQKRKVWKMAESFTSDFPYFKRCMTKSHVEKVFILVSNINSFLFLTPFSLYLTVG